MPAKERNRTGYKGVYWIQGIEIGTGKPERIYYIQYRKDGRLVEEKAGRQRKDAMTPARASSIRVERMKEGGLSNRDRREATKEKELEEQRKWTIGRLWAEYATTQFNEFSLSIEQSRYTNYLKSEFENKEPHDILQLDVDRIRIRLLKEKSPQTVKHILNLLDRIINYGVRKQLCAPLPFKIEKPRVNNLKTEDLSAAQLKKLMEVLDSCKDIQVRDLVRLALCTGMRRGEMFKLKWNDLDFERGFINLKDPKGGPDQIIPMNDMARTILEAHPRQGSYVFPDLRGKHYSNMNRALREIKAQVGLPKEFRMLHGLRHVYASMLASSGEVDMYVLQRLLTHKSPTMTQRYAHLRDAALKRAAGVAEDLLRGIIVEKETEKVVNLHEVNE
ncbi:MAG TPA: site-specific integrase [Thermodesulfobacteriota bacterium]|nr:site-specific integrase [Thermodesulfobacteriota bacterium]HNU71795.1 site-specific integrase [Thermodesulfobacteriota bacterium]